MRFPPDFTYPAQKTETAALVAECIAGLARKRRVVVQAGGCSGLWPLALAKHFDQVVTFEPDPTNFACLAENIAGVSHITAYPYALGASRRSVGLMRPKAQAGLWRVDGAGDVLMVPLDAVINTPIDALVLDVEGSEVEALTGAHRLLRRYQPVVWVEHLHQTDAIDAILESHGYTRPAPAVGADYYSVHRSMVA